MKRNRKFFSMAAVAAVAVVALAASATPQRGKPKYDPNAEVTIEGIVTEKISVPWGSSDCWGGEHLMVKTDKETIEVHVGPTWFLAREGFLVEVGERVSITGSRIQVDGKAVIITRTLRKDGKELEVRAKQGKPAWRGK